VQQVFLCVIALFPCKYLGIPLQLTRLKRCEEHSLVDFAPARIRTWKSGLLPMPAMCGSPKVDPLGKTPVVLSMWAVTQIDK